MFLGTRWLWVEGDFRVQVALALAPRPLNGLNLFSLPARPGVCPSVGRIANPLVGEAWGRLEQVDAYWFFLNKMS